MARKNNGPAFAANGADASPERVVDARPTPTFDEFVAPAVGHERPVETTRGQRRAAKIGWKEYRLDRNLDRTVR